MSATAAKHVKDYRRLCERCRDRKARFAFRRAVRADRHHTLCFACFRAQREHNRAVALADATPRPLGSPFGQLRQPLTDRQTAHRQVMLDHLARRSG
jgi:hypothetical protein